MPAERDSMGSLARALETFFTTRRLALPTDQNERLAAGRRRRRIDAVPEPLRPLVEDFATFICSARATEPDKRAPNPAPTTRSKQPWPSSETSPKALAKRGRHDWALIDVHDIEAFLAARPNPRPRRLVVLRQIFRFARSRKAVLVDPARALAAKGPNGFTGTTLTIGQQRALFRRWTTTLDPHPHEALLGLFALLHGASSRR